MSDIFISLLKAVRAIVYRPLLPRASQPIPDEVQLKAGTAVTNSTGMKLVHIPAGSFMMGCNDFGPCANESPEHEVHISEGFWMGQTAVTQGQYKSVMNA